MLVDKYGVNQPYNIVKGIDETGTMTIELAVVGNASHHNNTSLHNTIGSNNGKSHVTPASYKKPHRYCIFCNATKSKLTQHIKTAHRDEKEVEAIMKRPKRERNAHFEVLRKRGILEYNRKEATKLNPSYHGQKVTDDGKQLRICGMCNGFYNSSSIRRHQKHCTIPTFGSSSKVDNLPVTLLANTGEHRAGTLHARYTANILLKLRKDNIGELCLNDEVLLELGRRFYIEQSAKINKELEGHQIVRRDIRRLARLYTCMREAEQIIGPLKTDTQNCSVLFYRENYAHLEEAVTEMCIIDDSSDKDGLKVAMYYLIQKSATILKGVYSQGQKDDLVAEIDLFNGVHLLNKTSVFNSSQYRLYNRRQEHLRAPQNLPSEDLEKRVRDYCIQRLGELAGQFEFWSATTFTEARDLLVVRLTLFNGRRGGEPCRLLMADYQKAREKKWLKKSYLDKLTYAERELVRDLDITYQAGKGKGYVPCFFPLDTRLPLNKLIESRALANIKEANIFLFPCMNTTTHVSGYYAMRQVCMKLKIQTTDINATKNRHYLSTAMADMNVPEEDRQHIYSHFGHSEAVNKNIYQSPLALKCLTVVGSRLIQIDDGKCTLICNGIRQFTSTC